MNVMARSTLITALLTVPLCCVTVLPSTLSAQAVEQISIDAQGATTPFPHFWEQTFGSGRAILSLRESYRNDLRSVKQITNFDSVRFHGILMDEVGLYDPDRRTQNPGLAAQAANDASVYNFSYVDQIYDGLLARGVKPYVELSFMPPDLDSKPKEARPLWYHLIASPPKSYALWDGLIKTFARHLIQRYGIEEVSSWYFEVWNEPNIAFWNGTPAQASYFKLYDHTARDLKSVSPQLRVGGPSTASAAWVTDFLDHVHKNRVPVDFVSTHAYGDACGPAKEVHKQIEASPYPHLPFILSEFNATIYTVPNMTDSVYMGPFLANTIRNCAGNVDMVSYWAFSDVFEEQGVVASPFYGGYGLVAEDRIPKPAFNAFAMLHKLGRTRLPANDGPMLATRRKDGSVVLALWNYAAPVSTETTYIHGLPKGEDKHFVVDIAHLPAVDHALVWRLDNDHNNVILAFNAMGRPTYPSREQIKTLRQAAKLAIPEQIAVHDGTFRLDVPPQGLVVVDLH